jgi:hypothetical protein
VSLVWSGRWSEPKDATLREVKRTPNDETGQVAYSGWAKSQDFTLPGCPLKQRWLWTLRHYRLPGFVCVYTDKLFESRCHEIMQLLIQLLEDSADLHDLTYNRNNNRLSIVSFSWGLA